MRDGAGGYGQRESHVACRPLEPPSPNGLSSLPKLHGMVYTDQRYQAWGQAAIHKDAGASRSDGLVFRSYACGQ